MDEPLSNLDAKLRVEMRTVIKEIQRSVGITTIYVTHDQEEAMAGSDRIAIMKGGVIQHVGMELYGHTVSIFGFGAIGKRIANTAKNGFGMDVLVYDPFVSKEDIEAAGYQKAELSDALAGGDVISINLPVNKNTIGIVDASWFAQMKPEALFVNTARAAVVDQKAMIDAVLEKKIAGAATDVMWQEPAPANHPLLDRDNVLVTSHLAGMSRDIPNWQSVMVYDEIKRYAEGQAPKLVWTRTE